MSGIAPSPSRVCLGRIADAHGVRGLVKIQPYGEDVGLLEALDVWSAKDGGDLLEISLRNLVGRFTLAEIKGVADRDAALALRGTELWVARADLPEPDEDEFYIEDLKGLAVRFASGEDGGKIVAVQDFGAAPLLEIRPPSGPTWYLPFTREYVPDVDPEGGFVVIDPPEGLASE
ncbi:MAG: 16S rRNA processing protein RimM [Alphaproteobacteria bacterium]|nr:16S rRNA processing protein RimM [Alphaproteobacteria bacterium]